MVFIQLVFISAITIAGLSSCNLFPTKGRAVIEPPAAWKNSNPFPVASSEKDLTRWWSKFKDPTLTRLIVSALAANPDLASALSRVQEARARRAAESASLFPSLSASSSTNSNLTNREGQGTDSGVSYAANLTTSWEADLYGKNRSFIDAATAQVGASEENLHSVQASLASEISISYTNLRVAEAALEVLNRNIDTRRETSELAAWRAKSGVTDSLEAAQALSSLEQASATIPTLRQTIARNRNLLARLSGQTPGSLDTLLGSGEKTIPQPDSGLALGIPTDALRQRPDVRLAGYQLLAATATSRAIEATRYPMLNLSGTLGMNALRSGKIFNPETTAANLIVGFTGPIFDAGRIRSNIKAQNSVQEQAYQNYSSVVLTALSEVEDSLIACRRTTERLDSLEKATTAAREAALLAQERYRVGVIDILTVLDTQRVLLTLEDSLLSTRASRTIAFIQLYRGLGGGWS
jgi:outer membrane protein, multidrug efflux system